MKLVTDTDGSIAEWVASRIEQIETYKPCVAIGVVDGDRLLAACLYNLWSEKYRTMQISIAADSPRWAKRWTIRGLLAYPFEGAGVRKLWACIASGNDRSLKLATGVGFKPEGTLARHFGDQHAVMLRMFDSDFRRLYGGGDA